MELNFDALNLFHERWALLTAGDMERCNAMTISWGGLGTLWNKPVVSVYIKPIRYTHEFMEESDVFTVSFFGMEQRPALTLLGTLSGRDGDKIAQSGLTKQPAGEGVGYNEAEVTLVCRKIYRQDLDKNAMPADVVAKYYTEEAEHTLYVGEVIDIIRK